ncbi:MAG TPA: pitrilysin family protein [Longimicrobiales bacterium]|nr:pitrilysin family protein [Longimicrobiales bacterium]
MSTLPVGLCTRVLGLPLLALAATAALFAPVQGQARDAVRDTVLENGLEVIVLPNPATPVATLEIVVRAGAFTQVEAPDEGLPHVLEHLLFRTYRGGRGFASDASSAGASYNGTTGDERVTYYVTLPAGNVERGIELLSELVRAPNFDRRALDDERLVVQGELQRLASDPYTILGMVSDMVLWRSAFRRKNAIGNMVTIQNAQTDRLRDHYRKYYLPNNAALIASGDVRAEEVFRWAADRFRRWERGPDPFLAFTPPEIQPLSGDTAFVVDMPSSDVTFVVKWHGPSVSDDPVGTLAADVFSTMFNQSISGTQRRLVDSGIFQSVSLGYQTLEHVGPVVLTARATPERIARALLELGLELSLLSDTTYFGEADLAAAKRSLLVDAAIGRESSTSAAHTLASFWAVGGLAYYLGYEEGLQAVTTADIRAYLDRYLSGRPRVIALLATDELTTQLAPVIHDVVRSRWPQAP